VGNSSRRYGLYRRGRLVFVIFRDVCHSGRTQAASAAPIVRAWARRALFAWVLVSAGWVWCVLDRECDFYTPCFVQTFFPVIVQ
jgi:hypothetical protein